MSGVLLSTLLYNISLTPIKNFQDHYCYPNFNEQKNRQN